MDFVVKVTKNNQLTIPKSVREALEIKPGKIVQITISVVGETNAKKEKIKKPKPEMQKQTNDKPAQTETEEKQLNEIEKGIEVLANEILENFEIGFEEKYRNGNTNAIKYVKNKLKEKTNLPENRRDTLARYALTRAAAKQKKQQSIA